MSIRLTEIAERAANNINTKINLVLKIEGYDTIFGANNIFKYVRIGDPGLLIGNDWRIGGISLLADQSPWIAFTSGGATTSQFTQQISADRAQGSSVTSVVVSVVDKNEVVSRLISPGFDLDEILGANIELKVGFEGTGYPEDYVSFFRGIIQSVDSSPGMVHFIMASSESKKNLPALLTNFSNLTTELGTAAVTEIEVDDPTLFEILSTNLLIGFSFRNIITVLKPTRSTHFFLTSFLRSKYFPFLLNSRYISFWLCIYVKTDRENNKNNYNEYGFIFFHLCSPRLHYMLHKRICIP